MASLPYIEQVPANIRQAFVDKLVNQTAKNLKTDPAFLMIVMMKESGVSPSIQNKYYFFNGANKGYATGLIQFTPDTAATLGTSTEALRRMNHVEQLDYVEKFYKAAALNRGFPLKDYFSVYLTTFFPAAIPYVDDDNWVFQAKGISAGEVVKGNPPLDLDKDGKLTMGEFKKYLIKGLPQNIIDTYIKPAEQSDAEKKT